MSDDHRRGGLDWPSETIKMAIEIRAASLGDAEELAKPTAALWRLRPHTLSDFDTRRGGNGCEASGIAWRWKGPDAERGTTTGDGTEARDRGRDADPSETEGKSAAPLGGNNATAASPPLRALAERPSRPPGQPPWEPPQHTPDAGFLTHRLGITPGLGGSFQRAGLPSGEPRRGISLGGKRPAVKAPLWRCKQRP